MFKVVDCWRESNGTLTLRCKSESYFKFASATFLMSCPNVKVASETGVALLETALLI